MHAHVHLQVLGARVRLFISVTSVAACVFSPEVGSIILAAGVFVFHILLFPAFVRLISRFGDRLIFSTGRAEVRKRVCAFMLARPIVHQVLLAHLYIILEGAGNHLHAHRYERFACPRWLRQFSVVLCFIWSLD